MKLYEITFEVTAGEYQHLDSKLYAMENQDDARVHAEIILSKYWGEAEGTLVISGIVASPDGDRIARIYSVHEVETIRARDANNKVYLFVPAYAGAAPRVGGVITQQDG